MVPNKNLIDRFTMLIRIYINLFVHFWEVSRPSSLSFKKMVKFLVTTFTAFIASHVVT